MGLSGDEILAALRAHEPELRAAGVAGLSLVGSSAYEDDREMSAPIVVVRLEPDAVKQGFAYFGMLDQLAQQIETIVQRPIGVVAEPVQKSHLRREVERHGIVAF
jgi:predicted nucleotidyltransferase